MQQQNTTAAVQNKKVQQKKKTKKQRDNKVLRSQDFEKRNGLHALYELTQGLNLQNAETNVDLSMKKIVVALKSWQYNLNPHYSYDYFLQRCQALGNDKQLLGYVNQVRKIHKGQANWIQENPGAQNQNEERKGQENNNVQKDLQSLQRQGMQEQAQYRNRMELQNINNGYIQSTTPHNIDLDMNIAQEFQKLQQIEKMIQTKRKQVQQSRRPKPLIERYDDGCEDFDFHANQYDE